MITGILVLTCIVIGCVVALFVGLATRRRWYFGALAGIAASLTVGQIIGFESWDSEFFWEGLARLAALTVLPVAIVAWLSARRTRKSLGEIV